MKTIAEFGVLWLKYFWINRSPWDIFKKFLSVPIFLLLTAQFWVNTYHWISWHVILIPYNPLVATIFVLYLIIGLILYPNCFYYWWFIWLDKRVIGNTFSLANGNLFTPQQQYFGIFAWLFRPVWHFQPAQILLVLWPLWFSLSFTTREKTSTPAQKREELN
ncbi:hypothetical protein [Secundilactobacillus folii]|uniref:Uncharacterized protein n=1 Tax=Secundilactobacillus folii TaxID=2678357 RepID=A0A7X2XVJ7_9LACO|nr:hypothetical protein [Secundilactobacillus folii]MTV81835.1 hypothetical protein [Secundilactobacillus folii]